MITILSQYVTKILKLLSRQYLYISLRNVKTYGLFFIFSTTSLCVFNTLQAKTNLLAIGEHTELSIEEVSFYNIGNKEVLSSKAVTGPNTLILKGISRGNSELLLKFKNGRSQLNQYTVVSKSKKLKLLTTKHKIENYGLNVKMNGELIEVSGIISKLSYLNSLLEMEGELPEIELGQIQIPKRYRNSHIAEIYRYFWRDGIKEVTCELKKIHYFCYYHSSDLSPSVKKLLKQFRFLTIIKLEKNSFSKICLNYKIWKVSLINQISNDISAQNEVTNHSQSSINNLWFINLKKPIFFEGRDLFLSLNSRNAKAEIMENKNIFLSPGKKTTLSSGVKIPVTSRNETTTTVTTKWQFIGAKSTFTVNKKNHQYELDIESDISSPIEDSSYSYEKISTNLDLSVDEEVIIYSQQMRQLSTTKKSLIPIPILRDIELFKINSRKKNNNYILASVKLTNNCPM